MPIRGWKKKGRNLIQFISHSIELLSIDDLVRCPCFIFLFRCYKLDIKSNLGLNSLCNISDSNTE